ncbi:MAG: RNHCP domain-containing protein [Spirochaetia bacterium]
MERYREKDQEFQEGKEKITMDRKSIKINRTRAAGDPSFICSACGGIVHTSAPGTGQRNHCPHCLHSMHVDIVPGDRRELCRGMMEPISLWVRTGGDTALLHRCRRCGALRSNRIAGDDNPAALRKLAESALHAVAGPDC